MVLSSRTAGSLINAPKRRRLKFQRIRITRRCRATIYLPDEDIEETISAAVGDELLVMKDRGSLLVAIGKAALIEDDVIPERKPLPDPKPETIAEAAPAKPRTYAKRGGGGSESE